MQPVQIALQSLPALQEISTPAQLGIGHEFTEGTLNPSVQVINKCIG